MFLMKATVTYKINLNKLQNLIKYKMLKVYYLIEVRIQIMCYKNINRNKLVGGKSPLLINNKVNALDKVVA